MKIILMAAVTLDGKIARNEGDGGHEDYFHGRLLVDDGRSDDGRRTTDDGRRTTDDGRQ